MKLIDFLLPTFQRRVLYTTLYVFATVGADPDKLSPDSGELSCHH
jgi:hypothetical protein